MSGSSRLSESKMDFEEDYGKPGGAYGNEESFDIENISNDIKKIEGEMKK